MKRNVGIFIFDEAEVLDFAGPFEVFSVSSQLNDHALFNVFTLAKTRDAITAVNGLSVNPDYAIEEAPSPDILILAGGNGTRKVIKDKEVINWIKAVYPKTEIIASVCSGSRMLAMAGLLKGKPYCTHHQVYGDMQELVPDGAPQKNKRFTNSGNIYSSGGISAGIDMSFHLVEKLHGKEVAQQTAGYMEYRLL
ncbi:DJ-1/PfpI family protein [Ascidiimonas aurantiaca]|uniref:DJ-1/PfpI family protein n=1 Tax=Ascidiimonas aurantiaca TaxID=1685432 RepID=UPI0030EDF067